jgi:hypothetical protein
LKKVLLTTAILLGCAWLFIAPAQAAGNGSFTLDGQYSRRLSGFLGHDNGLGASWLLEWQPVEFFSIGAGMDALFYFGMNTPDNFVVESINLAGRFIFNPGNPLTAYMLVGGGLNPKLVRKTALHSWDGDFRLMGGPGVWCFLSPQTALDLGLLFDYDNNTAPIDPINALTVRVGLSFFFEKPQKPAATAAPAPSSQNEERVLGVPISKQEMGAPAAMPQTYLSSQTPVKGDERVLGVPITKQERDEAWRASAAAPATAVVQTSVVKTPAGNQREPALSKAQSTASNGPKSEPQASSPSMETSHELSFRGHSLWDTAARADIYGDPELYPLLVDANREVLKPKQFVLGPDTKLVVPRNPTQEMIDQARKNAWTAKYQSFSGRRLTPEGYQRWREAHPVPLISKE